MNFEILKKDFKSYLDEQVKTNNITENTEEETRNIEKEETNNCEISLFEHAEEFQTYLDEKVPNAGGTKSVDEVLKMQISSDGKIIEKDNDNQSRDNEQVSLFNKTEETDTSDKVESTGKFAKGEEESTPKEDDVFTNVFNELLKEDKFKNTIDTDKSGDINEEEMKNFVERIKGLDENDKDISVKDLLTAADQIKNDVFNVAESEDKFTDKEVENIKQDIADNKPASFETVPSRSNVGGVYPSNGVSYYTQNSKPNSYDSSISEKTPDNMSEEELKRELEIAKNDLSEKENKLTQIIEETDSSIKELKDNVDKTYEAYQEKVKAVDVDMAKQLDELNQKINVKQNEVNAKDSAIATKEGEVSSSESAYNSAKSNRENLESILNELKSSNTKDNNVSSQISEVNSQISAAKKAEESAKQAVEKAKKELEELKSQKKELDSGLSQLKEQMTKLECEIAVKHSEVEQAQSEWDKAKEKLTTEKSAATEKAQTNVTSAQNRVNEVEKALSEYKNNDAQSKYNNQYNETAGKKLASAAHNVRGTVGYCLGGVADTLEAVYGAGCIPNINSAYQAADLFAANTGIGAHFTEVQVKREDLPKLPAGAIVVWNNNANGGGSNVSAAGKVHGHISIALGNGQESSDHIADQIVNRDATFRVFYPKS